MQDARRIECGDHSGLGRDIEMIGLVSIIIFWAAIVPLITLIHNLGHAAAALALVPEHGVVVRLGSDPKISLVRRGRLEVLLQPWSGWVGRWGWTAGVVEARRAHFVWIMLAGPLASILAALLFGVVKSMFAAGPLFMRDLAQAGMVAAIIQFAASILPVTYPSWLIGYSDMWSDGLRLWRCLAGKTTE
jgi:hypothetical protein